MLLIITFIVIAVVVYHWVDKENFYGALVESKDTAKFGVVVGKEGARTAVKGWKASKAVYVANKTEHEKAYAEADTTYEQETFKRNKATITSIKKVFEPANTYFDETKIEADKRTAAANEFLNSLPKA